MATIEGVSSRQGWPLWGVPLYNYSARPPERIVITLAMNAAQNLTSHVYIHAPEGIMR